MSKRGKGPTVAEIREQLDKMELSVNHKDCGEYVELVIDIDKYNLKAYERNRAARTGHTYDPLSKYKVEFHKVFDTEIKKFIPEPLLGYCYIEIDRYLTMPKSTSMIRRKAAANKEYLPTKKPDNDNIEKIIYDLMNNLVYHDDGQIVENRTRKFFGDDHRTLIRIKIYKEEFKIKRGK